MYALLKQCKVKTTIALSLGLLYATTFSINTGRCDRGFSSWGAALLPFVLFRQFTMSFIKK